MMEAQNRMIILLLFSNVIFAGSSLIVEIQNVCVIPYVAQIVKKSAKKKRNAD